MIVGMVDGKSASGAIAISKLFGEPPYFAASLTVVLIVMGLFFGLRALILNKVCVGEKCEIDHEK